MEFPVPETLQSGLVSLRRLREDDFESLYAVASDPLLWEQHPNPDRYNKDVFQIYFQGAMASGAAFLVTESATGKILGCSRYYEFDAAKRTISIGYTFLSRECWGKGYNRDLKSVMLEYAFRFADSVIFHVGKKNMRSRKAMEKLGAVNTGEADMSYYGEASHTNIIYRIDKLPWTQQNGPAEKS